MKNISTNRQTYTLSKLTSNTRIGESCKARKINNVLKSAMNPVTRLTLSLIDYEEKRNKLFCASIYL